MAKFTYVFVVPSPRQLLPAFTERIPYRSEITKELTASRGNYSFLRHSNPTAYFRDPKTISRKYIEWVHQEVQCLHES